MAVKRRAADFDPEEVDAIMNHAPLNEAVVGHWLARAKQPPTPKQLEYLPRWARAGDWTRYEASCHLAARFNNKIIDRALALPEREVA